MGRGKTTYDAETEGCSWPYRTGENEETYWTKSV